MCCWRFLPKKQLLFFPCPPVALRTALRSSLAEDLRLTLDLAAGYPSPAEILQHSQKVRFRSRRCAWPLLSPAQPWPLTKSTHTLLVKGAVFWSPPGPLYCLSFAEGQRVHGVQAVKSSRDVLLFLSFVSLQLIRSNFESSYFDLTIYRKHNSSKPSSQQHTGTPLLRSLAAHMAFSHVLGLRAVGRAVPWCSQAGRGSGTSNTLAALPVGPHARE